MNILRILLIEDDPLAKSLFLTTFNDCLTETVDSLAGGIKAVRERKDDPPFDVIIVDSDVDSADSPSVEILQHIAELRGTRLVVYRDGDPLSVHRLKQQLCGV